MSCCHSASVGPLTATRRKPHPHSGSPMRRRAIHAAATATAMPAALSAASRRVRPSTEMSARWPARSGTCWRTGNGSIVPSPVQWTRSRAARQRARASVPVWSGPVSPPRSGRASHTITIPKRPMATEAAASRSSRDRPRSSTTRRRTPPPCHTGRPDPPLDSDPGAVGRTHYTAVVRRPRILAVASAVDLEFRYGCTPAWWQLWKALYEVGVDLIVAPYRGRPVESPWWRTAPNPTYRQGEAYAGLRLGVARLSGDRYLRRHEGEPKDSAFDRVTRETIWKLVTPRWRRHLDRLVERERPDAVIVFTVPMAHFRGIPTYLRERHGVPVVYYDGDVPASLPEFGGLDAGFNHYHGADLSEYDLVLSNSEGGLSRLLALGARRAESVFWAADPEFFRPMPVAKEVDAFFYGYGTSPPRVDQALIAEPSRREPRIDFAVGGRDFRGRWERTARRGRPVQHVLPRDQRRADQPQRDSRRARHGRWLVNVSPVRARGCGAAIVSNPHAGIERWFEPGSELVVVNDADEALDAYRALLDDPGEAVAMGLRPVSGARRAHLRPSREAVLELVELATGTPPERSPARDASARRRVSSAPPTRASSDGSRIDDGSA